MSESADDEASLKSDFIARVIPYDTCEDPNAPILASSGENINLIFKIPKESFRKLAIAAITHLDDDSNFEKAGTSKYSKELLNNKSSNEKSNFSLGDVVQNPDSENTNDIDAYEDSNESDKLKKSPESSNLQATVPVQTSDDGSATDEKCNEQDNSDSVNSTIGNNSIQKESSDILYEKRECEDRSETLTESSGNHADKELNCRENKDCLKDSSDRSLDLSKECPELENAWPNIESFTKTEEIPVTELKSLELHGILTKYLKLELSNEFVVIKVTSESDVLVDAVKYKEMGSDSNKETEKTSAGSEANNEHEVDISIKESECSVIDGDISVGTLTADSITETVHSVNENGEHEEPLPCILKEYEIPEPISEEFEPKNDLRVEYTSTTSSNEALDNYSSQSTKTTDVKNFSSSDHKTEDKDIIIGDVTSENKSVDKGIECESPEKSFEDLQFGKMISPKIEQKLEELDTNISGCSPTERLKFTLNDCLRTSSDETEAKQKVTEPDISESLSISDFNDNTSENNLQIEEKSLKKDSLNEYVTESLETKDSTEQTVERDEDDSSNKENYTENDSFRTDPEHDSVSPEKESMDNSLKIDESESVNEDSETEKSVANDQELKSENYTAEAKMGKISFKFTEEKDSLEDSALGKDLHFSESEVLNDCGMPKDTECEKICSQDMTENIPPENVENVETVNEKPITTVNAISNVSDVPNKQCEEDVVEETSLHAKIVTDGTELKNFENSLSESVIEEKDVTTNTLIEDTTNAEISFDSNESKHELSELKDTAKEEIETKNILEKDADYTSVNATLKEVLGTDQGCSKADIGTLKDSLDKNSEYSGDSVSEKEGLEKLPENSFASRIDSFLDSTVDANSESASECGDLESDVKSVASESDDSKDSDKQTSLRRRAIKNKKGTDEVECAPTRVRTRKAITGLSKFPIPENAEVKNTRISNSRSSTLDAPSKYSERTSPASRSLRSKSLDPTPNDNKKHCSTVENEVTRRTRAKTPDIIGKKDIKTTVRSSPRKLARSATAESSSTSKVQSTVSSFADSKSRANSETPMSTKRSKRNSKD